MLADGRNGVRCLVVTNTDQGRPRRERVQVPRPSPRPAFPRSSSPTTTAAEAGAGRGWGGVALGGEVPLGQHTGARAGEEVPGPSGVKRQAPGAHS